MSKQIIPSDGVIISREWLEKKTFATDKYLSFCDDKEVAEYNRALKQVLENSQPLAPVLEVVTDEVIEIAACHTDCELDKQGAKANANNFLNNPIEIK